MLRRICLSISILLLPVAPTAFAQTESDPVAYPETPRVARVDDYHGTKVADPYRWLEALGDSAVAEWVEAQNAVARPYLESLPSREAYEERLTELLDYERYTTPTEKGGRYFYSHNDGLQSQNVL